MLENHTSLCVATLHGTLLTRNQEGSPQAFTQQLVSIVVKDCLTSLIQHTGQSGKRPISAHPFPVLTSIITQPVLELADPVL